MTRRAFSAKIQKTFLMEIQDFYFKLSAVLRTIEGLEDLCEVRDLEEAKCAVEKAYQAIQEE